MDVLWKLAERFARIVRGWDDILVVGHYDADGITATALVSLALENLGKEYKFMNLKQLYSEDLQKIGDSASAVIFVDFGAGQLPLLQSLERPFIVIDHHIPSGDHPYLFHPSLAGLKGELDISGAGLAYIFSRALGLDPSWAKLALVGAVGDMQVREGRLAGKGNREILADAIRSGSVFTYKDLALYGRVSRPLPLLFLFSTEPILPGLTANEPGVYRFLEGAGIPLKEGEEWRAYVDLSQVERRKLFTALFRYLLRRHWSRERIQSLIGEVYDIVGEELHSPLREAREFSTLLNATGRHGRPEVGVHVCMGDRDSWYTEAMSLLRHHRRVLREGIEWVLDHGVSALNNLYYFHAGHRIPAPVVGIVAGMVYGSGLIPTDKPIVAFAFEEDYVKVSARAHSSHTKKGINLGVAIREAASAVGGEGGGHPPAAGARIPRGSEEEFLQIFDMVLDQMLRNPKFSSSSGTHSGTSPWME